MAIGRRIELAGDKELLEEFSNRIVKATLYATQGKSYCRKEDVEKALERVKEMFVKEEKEKHK